MPNYCVGRMNRDVLTVYTSLHESLSNVYERMTTPIVIILQKQDLSLNILTTLNKNYRKSYPNILSVPSEQILKLHSDCELAQIFSSYRRGIS